MIDPLVNPKHVILVGFTVAFKTGGCVTVIVPEETVHPPLAVMVKEYVPAARPVMSSVVAPFDYK